MVTWVLYSLAVAVATAQTTFFGQRFVGEQGSELQIADAGLTEEDAWKSYSCDVTCGETCLNVATGHYLQACIGFCGCARFIEAAKKPAAADILNSLPEECPATCEALCDDSHCVEECKSSFCVSSESVLSFYVGAALEAVGLLAILLFLKVCYGRMQSKRRRRMRLAQETEGTYSML